MSDSTSRQHHVSRNGETLGPWTVEMIALKLSEGSIAITDFVWDEAAADWVTLMEFGELKSHLQSKKPAARPAPATTNVQKTAVQAEPTSESPAQTAVVGTSMSEDDAICWYVTRGGQKFGPFNYYGVVKALQDKSIFEFDLIWKEGMTDWVRIAEHEKFDAETIRELLSTLEKKRTQSDVFAQRRHPRMAVENEVLVSDNQNVSTAKMVEGSAGGSGLIIRNSGLLPGQLVQLHFSAMDGLPAFNAVGEIVSKKYSRAARNLRAPVHYGIRFVKLDAAAEEQVQNYFKTRATRVSA
ncbi:MAG: GYF domain-containing protein [Bdellovibrionales bacterium]|nr:GYF domain-containing protein [Bdellovibrionales bacterium]